MGQFAGTMKLVSAVEVDWVKTLVPLLEEINPDKHEKKAKSSKFDVKMLSMSRE
jgi:hypothetical protein